MPYQPLDEIFRELALKETRVGLPLSVLTYLSSNLREFSPIFRRFWGLISVD
jgi:hypothetical protein